MVEKLSKLLAWKGMELPERIPQGDMPGDKIEIGEAHIRKADVIFPELVRQLIEVVPENPAKRAVVTVCGGSGVGKSELASILSYYLNQNGIGSYTLSGDNYPRRIPLYNDAERLHLFRQGGMRALAAAEVLTPERVELVQQWQREAIDAEPRHLADHPWYAAYLAGGRQALEGYLGTDKEIDFAEVEQIVRQFKDGQEQIWLKRMGRDEASLWYEKVDFGPVQVLIIEWTHGNSDGYRGVDIPILLNSTPQETLAHRRSRNRDGAIDSAFTTLVLEIEQRLLQTQAPKARLIVAKDGTLLSYADYVKQMLESEG